MNIHPSIYLSASLSICICLSIYLSGPPESHKTPHDGVELDHSTIHWTAKEIANKIEN